MKDLIPHARKAASILAGEFGHSKLADQAVHAFITQPAQTSEQLRAIVPPALLPLVVASMDIHYHVCRAAGSGQCNPWTAKVLLKKYFPQEYGTVTAS